jgi:uncharacterized protein YecE (DUF72 family)
MASRDLQPGSNQVRILSGAAPRPHPGYSAAERFDYLYDERQLQAWVGPLRELAMQSEKAYAMFNDNNQTNGIAQARRARSFSADCSSRTGARRLTLRASLVALGSRAFLGAHGARIGWLWRGTLSR